MNFRDNLLRKARKSKKKDTWTLYKRQKNYVNNLIKKAMSDHHKTQLEENISKAEVSWNYIKKLFPAKSKKNQLLNSW